MKIGVFDSGLGGLVTLKGAAKALAPYDLVYLGDTANLPYGDKTKEQVFEYTRKAVEYLFKQDCKIVFLFCNTASAEALRKIQQEFLPNHYPDRRVLGIIIPTVQEITGKRVGILATQGTVDSQTYIHEIHKINPEIQVFQQAAPKLVPLIESNHHIINTYVIIMSEYVKSLLDQNIDTLVLGCTHYVMIKSEIKKLLPTHVQLISQDEIIGKKITDYVARHSEIESTLSKNKTRQYLVTKLTQEFDRQAREWFGPDLKLSVIVI